MFLKLLRYKFNAHRNLFIILSVIALSMSAVGAGALWFLRSGLDHISDGSLLTLISIFSTIFFMVLLGIIYCSLVAYIIAMAIVLFVQFYKNHFSDEGYLTFTLPVTTHQHLLSSFLNILIWAATTILVMFICIFILNSPDYSLFEFIQRIRGRMLHIGIERPIVFSTLLSTSSLLTVCLIPMLAICIGCVAAKKRKFLASLGIGYGIISTITVLTYILMLLSIVGDAYIMYAIESQNFYFILTLLVPLSIHAAVCIGGYFLMHRLVDRKLNLP